MKSDLSRMSKKQITVLFLLTGTLVFFLLALFSLFPNSKNFISKQEKNQAPWPPLIAHSYPDLELVDQEGEPFRLSYLKGKVIVILPVAMKDPVSQANAGAENKGSFEGINYDPLAPSFHKLFAESAKDLVLPDPDLVFVHLLLYDMKYESPKPLDAKKWAEHFDLRRGRNHFVTVSKHRLGSNYGNDITPGFQLIDRDFVLRADSTGSEPQHDLRHELIPLAVKLLESEKKQ